METQKFKTQNKAQLSTAQHSYQAHQEGFVLITTLTLLPLLLSLCFLIVAFTNYSYVHVSALNLCRKHLLIGQDKIRYQMYKLKKLNPKAERLRDKHDRALKRLQQSKTYVELIANTLRYTAVLTEQTLFAARQKKHIAIAKMHGKTQKNLLRKKLFELNKKSQIHISDFPFEMKPQQSATLTPDYDFDSSFESAQITTASWTMQDFNTKLIAPLIRKVAQPSIQGVCSTTIDINKGPKWQAILVKKDKL